MASPHMHAPGLDQHHQHHQHHHLLHHDLYAPLNVTSLAFTHTLEHPADSSGPPSPTAIAAAATLAALADGRPLPTLAEHADDDNDDDDDDDDSGGIAITSTDLQQYTAASSAMNAYMTEQDIAEQLPSIMAESPSHPPTIPAAAFPFDSYEPLPPHLFPSGFAPIPHIFSGHTSSSDLILEPLPPTLQEAHLSIEDNGSFAPITSFFHSITPPKPTVPGLDLITVPPSITRHQLEGDRFDSQGIDWAARNTTRSHMRAKRRGYEVARLPLSSHQVRNVSLGGRLSSASANHDKYIPPSPNTDNFFRFQRNNTTHRAFFPHFQLRNVLAATSRNDIYYAAGQHVLRTDAQGSVADVMVDFSNRLSVKGSITTIASTDSVLIAGAFDGEYSITDLSSSSENPSTFGRTSDLIMDTRSRIVNHMHLYNGRTTYHPQAVLCSNDFHLRVLDCMTNQFTHSFLYPAAVNCSATSPDGRMRVVVGDFQETLITNAETGRPFETLNSHTDDAFACAWADDGVHVATAAQDSTIVVWDARYWSRPLNALTSEVSVPRSLRFSPVGSGPRVLIAAEADDYVNVFNAQTFESKQVFDFFGAIGGVTFTPDGQSLFIANGERRFGGIVELERTGWAEGNVQQRLKRSDDVDWDDPMSDWAYDDQLSSYDRALSGDVERERRGIDLGSIVV
ncbi:WD40-repeat-containing domain protein [Phaeosphaeria sp. MPI-PUGE-AT-0046c]|nr:WD40-repeat-containing domain protein [Phaeosphaeria sp. MPI-PUGE-AT-0046c]